MRILFCGDLVGRSGRNAAITMIPRLRREMSLDFVVVNGENAAGGFGITEPICRELYDAGVCDDYDSVIGMQTAVPIARFTSKLPTERMAPADGPATLCGLFVETDDKTGLARRATAFREGGVLSPERPAL